MTIKNVILGLVAMVLAVSGSYASMLSPIQGYINVRYSGSQSWVCIQAGTCDDPSGFTCAVFVPDLVTNVPMQPVGCPSIYLQYTSSTAVASYDDAGTIIEWR